MEDKKYLSLKVKNKTFNHHLSQCFGYQNFYNTSQKNSKKHSFISKRKSKI